MIFDFGIPLEDVFPSNDIHPRLKQLFQEAYQYYIICGVEIDKVLRNHQGSVQQRLNLKELIVYNEDYKNLPRHPVGTYFWLIRHFLGLMPIPLLPICSNSKIFDWERLSFRCKRFLGQYRFRRESDSELIYVITENLNSLSFHHHLLLKVLVTFIRKVAQVSPRNSCLSKKKIIILMRYFCGAIFNRPYMPGCETEDTKMHPLFIYILLRWRKIQALSAKLNYKFDVNNNENCSRRKERFLFNPGIKNQQFDYQFDDNNNKNCDYLRRKAQNEIKNYIFEPEVVPVYSYIPIYYPNNVYLKDAASQTELTQSVDAGVQSDSNISNSSSSEKSPVPLANSSIIDVNESAISDNDNYVTAIDKTNVESHVEKGENTYKSNKGSIKKVEGYIDDDYDTFHKEKYNQIGKLSFFEKFSKKNVISSSDSPEEDSYIRYDDIDTDFEKNCSEINTSNENGNETKNLNVSSNSKEPLTSIYKNEDDNSQTKSKMSFNLKRFKINMDFLKILNPKSANSFYYSKEVKYKQIKNDNRAKTL